MSRVRTFTAAAAVLVALAACDDGASAVETRERPAADAAGGPAEAAAAGGAGAEAGARPVMTANRRETVDEKVVRLFERNGADFGARSPADYLDKVRTFTTRPPEGTERVERPNGDVLLYQASTNTFAVVSREGVPKTMFKPDEGAAYWAEQKARAPSFGRGRGASAD